MEEREKVKFHRPPNNDDFKQGKDEKDMMAYVVLFQCSNSTAFALFNRHFTDKGGKLNPAGQKACRQFFSHPSNIAYMDALREHLAALMRGARVVASDTIDDTRKDNALKSLLNQAMSLVEKGEDLDAESLKTISEIFKKVGLLKDDVEVQEAPRRYLPERCSACLYRSFVESGVEGGEVINECDYCRTRRFAEENGWRFDPAKNLDLPPMADNGGAEAPGLRQKIDLGTK